MTNRLFALHHAAVQRFRQEGVDNLLTASCGFLSRADLVFMRALPARQLDVY